MSHSAGNIVLISLILTGCGAAPTQPAAPAPASAPAPVLGTADDVQTPAGDYDGYRVVRDCGDAEATLAVEGLGTHPYPGLEPPDYPGDVAAVEAFVEGALMPALADVASLHTHGFGAGCTRPGVFLELSDWGEVDTVIDRVGSVLRANDLDEQVTLRVRANEARLLDEGA